MPRRKKVTREAIWAAADRLMANGQEPTLAGVCNQTGGSYTTISAELAAWRERRSEPVQLAEPVPTAVAEAVQELAPQLWAVAVAEIDMRLAGERKAFAIAQRESEKQVAEATGIADELRADLDQTKRDLEQSQQETTNARENVARLTGQLEALRGSHQGDLAAILKRLPEPKKNGGE